MTSRILIFCSILSISNTSYSMESISKTNVNHQETLFQKQTKTLAKLSKATPIRLIGCRRYTFHMLSSEKDYKIFLTLPKELREPIAHLSNNIVGIIQHPKWYNNTLPKYMGMVIKLKWIIPENENKKKHSSKILIRQNTWCYCT